MSEFLPNRFEVLEFLGSGALGTVYKVRERDTGEVLAVKRLRPEATSEVTRGRFEREFQTMHRISHANIVNVREMGDHRGAPFFTMEYIDGGDMRWFIGEARPETGHDGFPFYCKRLAYIFFQVAAALDAVHDAGVIHRDIKPENIVMKYGRFPQAKLVDFGHARDDDEQDLTATGTVLGTAWYLSPEQAQCRPPTPQSDLYALGCVLFESLTASPPFPGNSVAQVLMGHLQPEVPDPRQIDDRVPDGYAEVCMHLMQKEPDDRPRNAREVGERLSAV